MSFFHHKGLTTQTHCLPANTAVLMTVSRRSRAVRKDDW